MIREENGRAVLHCDRCPARIDLGLALQVRTRPRIPTGWRTTALDRHECSLHDQGRWPLEGANPQRSEP